MSQIPLDPFISHDLAQYKPGQYKPEAQASDSPETNTQANGLKAQVIKKLRQKIRRTETASRNDDGTIVSSGSAAIDSLLPAGGYQRGTLVEWIADSGSGADFLSLTTARQAALDGGALVIVDSTEQFYPPAAAALGINLGNLILLRETAGETSSHGPSSHGQSSQPQTKQLDADDFLWAIDQSLRCPAVAAVWGHLPKFENSLTRERWLRRFQLSAESSGCLGLFLQPLEQFGKPSWAETQWLVNSSVAWPQGSENIRRSARHCRRVELKLARCRGSQIGQAITLDINTISGSINETPKNKIAIDSNANNQPANDQYQPAHTAGSSQSASFGRPLRSSRPLSVAAELAHPAADRRQTRA